MAWSAMSEPFVWNPKLMQVLEKDHPGAICGQQSASLGVPHGQANLDLPGLSVCVLMDNLVHRPKIRCRTRDGRIHSGVWECWPGVRRYFVVAHLRAVF